MTEEEKEIIDGCRRGDSSFQKRLYVNYGPMVKGICVRYTADISEAEDLFHDTFVYILTHFKNFENISSLGGWLRKITINKAIDHIRKKSLHNINTLSSLDIDIQDTSIKLNDTLSMDILVSFINKLPDKYRTVFNLFVIDGISQNEICKLTGETATNVRTLISRARATLRKEIEKYLEKDNITI